MFVENQIVFIVSGVIRAVRYVRETPNCHFVADETGYEIRLTKGATSYNPTIFATYEEARSEVLDTLLAEQASHLHKAKEIEKRIDRLKLREPPVFNHHWKPDLESDALQERSNDA